MAHAEAFHEPRGNNGLRWALIVGALAVVGGLLFYVVSAFLDIGSVKVEQAPPTMVDMLPPPPPPPPPPEEKPPEPQDAPKDVPDPVPQPDKPAPTPMQIDGPAQAGSDAYGMTAGSGGMGAPGGAGVCVGARCGTAPVAGTDRFWTRGAASALERHIENSGTVNVDAFVNEYEVWVDGTGNLTRARLVRSSGNARLDQTVLALLQTASGLRPPPASVRMPQRIKVGRKRV